MKETAEPTPILAQLVQYHQWANHRFLPILQHLTPEQWEETHPSSFNSIRRTVLHLWDAEQLWLKRMQGESPLGWPSAGFTGDGAALVKSWKATTQALVDFVVDSGEDTLAKVITYQNTRGDQYHQPVFEILLHVINHATYHRGQLITLLRQAGVVDGLPGTDLVTYWRRMGEE